MSGGQSILDPWAISPLDDELFDLFPVIRDIFRTRECIPGTVFLVEGLETINVSDSRQKIVRLLLGDGDLCIQAILKRKLFHLVETGKVAMGSYIRSEDFDFRWRTIPPGPGEEYSRQMVCLIMNSLEPVGWNDSYREIEQTERPKTVEIPKVKRNGQLNSKKPGRRVRWADDEQEIAKKREKQSVPGQRNEEQDEESDDASEAFETLQLPSRQPDVGVSSKQASRHERQPSSSRSQPIALPRDWHDPQTPLKLTTLRSIPHLPYAQNWSCNVLAIITSLSEVEPSNLPPYKQRTARIADPSTAKQVHLTVFLDPDEFTPKVGSAVLLVGVKNHRFDGGCLKKYASDKKEGRWWFEDPWDLPWCDVMGIKAWWADIQQSLQV